MTSFVAVVSLRQVVRLAWRVVVKERPQRNGVGGEKKRSFLTPGLWFVNIKVNWDWCCVKVTAPAGG